MLRKRPTSTVALKRVLRQGTRFVCGVCRKAYQTELEAERCLAACMHQHVNPKSTVAAEQHGGTKRYRCHFCKRVYEAEQLARACASECKKHTQETIAQDQKAKTATKPPPAAVAGQTASPSPESQRLRSDATIAKADAGRAAPPHTADAGAAGQRKQRAPVRRDEMHKYLRDGRKLICRKCGAEHPTLDTVIGCYDSHPEKQATPKAGGDDDKFFRDGAKYVCRNCQKKWFTRVEAVTCHDSHTGAARSSDAPAPAAPPPPAAAAPSATQSRIGSADDDAKFYRDGAKYVCRSCGKKVFTRSDVIACFDGHAGEPAPMEGGGALAPSPAPSPAPPPTSANSSDDDAKFYRDGAKYVCRKCNKKVFTRIDVIACFDGHV